MVPDSMGEMLIQGKNERLKEQGGLETIMALKRYRRERMWERDNVKGTKSWLIIFLCFLLLSIFLDALNLHASQLAS